MDALPPRRAAPRGQEAPGCGQPSTLSTPPPNLCPLEEEEEAPHRSEEPGWVWGCAPSEAHPGITVHLTALDGGFFTFWFGWGGPQGAAWGPCAQRVPLAPWTGIVLVIT